MRPAPTGPVREVRLDGPIILALAAGQAKGAPRSLHLYTAGDGALLRAMVAAAEAATEPVIFPWLYAMADDWSEVRVRVASRLRLGRPVYEWQAVG